MTASLTAPNAKCFRAWRQRGSRCLSSAPWTTPSGAFWGGGFLCGRRFQPQLHKLAHGLGGGLYPMLKAVLRDPVPLIPLEKNELAHAIRHMLYISYISVIIYIT